MESDITDWLLSGDISIRYQTFRDLLGEERPELQQGILQAGWGRALMRAQTGEGVWGKSFYAPKWTSTHYTLLDLRWLCVPPDHPPLRRAVERAAREEKGEDGGINPARSVRVSDVCINGMFLNYAAYFGLAEELLGSVIDFVLSQHMPDGGFNCRKNRTGCRHSSMHSTISVLEGVQSCLDNGYAHRRSELEAVAASGRAFLLAHRLFRSDRTGEVIHPGMTALPFPFRWKYSLLRALDHFRSAGIAHDERLEDALDLLLRKRSGDGTWKLAAAHPGAVHIAMERPGARSRWNTLLALRVLRHFGRA